jgi:hypothetical protein
MNRIDEIVKKDVDVTTYKFGLSTIHAWIRFFECLLHISYRLKTKKWQARGEEDQRKLQNKKQAIQDLFKNEMGLLVDKAKPDGRGTSNDGNTATRFFKNYRESVRITGVNKDHIRRFYVILKSISSGFELNTEEFDKYTNDTAKLFVQAYPWFYMPASIHKVLVHGANIISGAILPIGQLSKEAQESRNKDLKSFRRSHSRKMSRSSTNEDVFNLLLVSSDPLISSLRKLPKKSTKTYFPEALKLLDVPKEWEDLSSSNAAPTEDDSDATSEETFKLVSFRVNTFIFLCFYEYSLKIKKMCFQQ